MARLSAIAAGKQQNGYDIFVIVESCLINIIITNNGADLRQGGRKAKKPAMTKMS